MVLTSALIVGLARYLTDSIGGSVVEYVAVASLWALAVLLTLMTAEAAFRFSALLGVTLAWGLRLPYWRGAIHLFLVVITIAMLLAILAIGSQEAHKVANRAASIPAHSAP